MKARLAIASGLVAAVALAVAAAACSSDQFAPSDGGAEATPDQGSPGDGGLDAADAKETRPPGWCETNAPDATACADFDRADAATDLLPYWKYISQGNGQLTVGTGPVGAAVDAAVPSAPKQLKATITPQDAGLSVNTGYLYASAPVSSTEITLEFDIYVEPASYGSTEIVYAAGLAVNSNVNGLSLVLAQEGPSWQIRRTSPGFAIDSISLAEGTWHRISFTLKKQPATYLVSVDGNQIFANPLGGWPTNITDVTGSVQIEEVVASVTPRTRWFDNVVLDAK